MPGDIRLNIILDEHGSIKKIEATGQSIKSLKTAAADASPKVSALSNDIKNIAPPAGIATRGFTDIKTSVSNMVKSFGPGALAIAGIYGAFRTLSDSISLASEAIEQHSKLNAVFAQETASAAAAVGGLTQNYGLSTLEAEKMLGATGNLLTSFGVTQEEALKLSEQTQQLAVDLTSFTNFSGGAAEASQAISMALLGEYERIKQLGLAISDTEVQARLLQKGQQSLSGESLKAAKATATLELAFKMGKNAIGDYARTQDSFANQTRKMEAALQDLKVGIGQALIEGLQPALTAFSGWVKDNKDLIAGAFDMIGKAIRFAFGPAEVLSYISQLSKQTDQLRMTVAEQSQQWTTDFQKTYSALRQAGIGFEELDRITAGMQSAARVKELTEKQRELEKELKKLNIASKEAGLSYTQMSLISIKSADVTKKLNAVTSERSDLLSKDYQEIIRHNEKYGVSNEIARKAQEILRSGAVAQANATAVLKKSSDTQDEAAAIMKKYGVSLQSATEILQKMKPGLAQAAELQKKLGISEAESIRVVGILNGLETKKKATIDAQNIVIPELTANLDELNDITEALSGSEEDLGRVIDAGPTQAYYSLGSEINNTNEFLEENEDRTKAAAEAAKETEAAINGLTGMLDIMSSMADTPDELAIGFQALSGIIQNMASGNVVGAAIAGIGGLLSIITSKTKEAKSVLEEYNETINALNEAMGITYDELIRGQEALDGWVEKLLSGASLMEILGDKYDDFLKFLDRANMSLEEFMQKMKDDAVAAQAENLEKLRQTTEFYAKTVDEMLPSLENFLKVPAQNAEDFNSQVTITMSTFANLLKSGIPITEALDKMGTAFDSLIASQDKLGITGDATFQSLMKFRDLVSANKDLVNSVTGLNDVLAATAQMGALDQKTFDAFSKSAQSQFDQLTKAGFSASQAYQMLGPGLYELKKQIDLGTVSVDDNTKKLIANADAAGAFEGMADPMDTVASILGEIYLLLGGTEEKLDSLGVTGQASAAATASEFDKAAVSIYDMNGELQNADNAMSTMADTTGAAGKEMISVMDEFATKGSESVMTMAEAADQTAQDMKDSFSDMSKEGVLQVTDMVSKSAALLEKLGDIDLKLSLGGEIPPKGNTPTPPKKNFAMGTPDYGFVVPPGYPNDSYRVGLTSGERIAVSKSGDVNNSKSETVLNQAVYINNPVLSSGALALLSIEAIRENKNNFVTVLKKAVGNG